MTLFFFVLGKKHGQGNAEKGGLDLKIHYIIYMLLVSFRS